MGLMPGYKTTEVGVIPEDWEMKQIGDLKPFVTSGSRGWAAFYSDRGAPFIRITNLSRDSIYLDLKDLRLVNLPQDDSEGARTQLQNGDVLISITADVGIIGYVSLNVPKPAYINQHVALVRVDSSSANSKFVSYFLASETPQRLFRALTDSGAKAGMSLTTVQKIYVALPRTKVEQEAIAEALSDADALIESLDQLIAKKRHVKQGTMQELLTGKTRLPGFSGEWSPRKLGDLAVLSKAGVNPSASPDALFTHFSLPAFDAGATPVSEPGNLIGSNKFIVLQSAVLVSKLNPRIPRVWVPTHIPENAVCSTEFLVLLPREKTDRNYLAAVCLSSEFCYQMELHATGTTGSHQRIPPLLALAIEVTAPDEESEQTAIVAILSDMDAEIAALEAKLSKARQIKQGMMHNLLTGRIRLV